MSEICTLIRWSAVWLALVVAGCSTPNTPGAGFGADYTPVIDLQGVDPARYQADLGACRRLAGNIDVNRATTEGAVAGVFVGALVSGMLGGGRQTTMDAANIGVVSGIGQAGGQAIDQAKRIVINCMVGRGYRALEVTPALGSYQQPIQSTAVAPTPTMQTPLLPQPAANPKPPAEIGQYAYEAERIPAAKACAAIPQATLVNKGPGFELYSVACRNADTLMVRCELGNCRALR